ncbi:ArsR/SmtB family transcription factor [Chloroflexota bacterium]
MGSTEELELYRLKAELCKTFGDAKRLMLINGLRSDEKLVGDLAREIGVSQAVVSRHLAVLRHRGIVIARRAGKHVYYRLADPKIANACDLVHEVLLNQLTKNTKLAEKMVD